MSFHALLRTEEYARTLSRRIWDRDVVELGVGIGSLTRLLLEAGCRSVVGFENDPSVEVDDDVGRDPRFELRREDYTTADLSSFAGKCVVSNPSYSTLPFVLDQIVPRFHDVIVMIPPRHVSKFLEQRFRLEFSLDGSAFQPAATGQHLVVRRGLEPREPLVDLHHECSKLTGTRTKARLRELNERVGDDLPSVSLIAFGGVPIVSAEGERGRRHPTWAGHAVDPSRLSTLVEAGLGASAVLTYLNPKGRTLSELGQMCGDRSHRWAFNWMTASILIVARSRAVELAFARDRGFYLSWTEEKEYSGETLGTFVASGTLRDWERFSSKRSDESFDRETRKVMAQCSCLLRRILP